MNIKRRSFHKTSPSNILGNIQTKWRDRFVFQSHKMQIQDKRGITDKQMVGLVHDISRKIKVHNWKRLSYLVIQLPFDFSKLTDESLRAISRLIRIHFKDLRAISIDCTSIYKFKNKGFELLSQALSRSLSNVKVIKLRFNGLSEQHLRIITNTFSRTMRNIRHLSIDLRNFVASTPSNLCKLGWRIIQNMSTVQDLNIALFLSEAQTLQELDKLITRTVRHLTKISQLSLSLTESQEVAIDSLSHLIRQTKGILNIRSLKLSLEGSECSIDTAEIKVLMQLISNNLVNLESLCLIFANCVIMGDQDFTISSYELAQNLRNLKCVDLDLFKCEITGKKLQSLICEISNSLVHLPQLRLGLGGSDKLTDNEVMCVGREIGDKLKGLKELNINFRLCQFVSEKGFNTFCLEVKENLRELQVLELNFFPWTRISKGARNNAVKELSYIPRLNM